MKKYSKYELTQLVASISDEVSKSFDDIVIENTENTNSDAVNLLAEYMAQVQRNCEQIIIKTLDSILND